MTLIGALALLILAGLYGGNLMERNRRIAELQALRAALDRARFSADSCKVALSWEEQGFLAFDRLVDSLRTDVEGFEDPDRGGVPHAEYEAYLESFQRYNDSVAVWQARADTLQMNEAACRGLIEAHNALGDSIRRRQEAIRGQDR